MPAPKRRHRAGGAYPQPPIPPDEPERLKTLRQLDILDSEPEQAYDDLTLLASHICGTPIALVSLVDRDRQWFKSRIGLEPRETPRDIAFCAHAIAGTGTLIVEDTERDDRFARNPLVLSDPKIRFYAGAPLRMPEGHALGTLCVIDRVPRELTRAQQAALEALARQVVAQLELRRKISELQRDSMRDPLTGLFNRGYFDAMLPVELERAKRYGFRLSLLLVEADHFQRLNDRFGQQEGERVLTILSAILSRTLRAADVVCRFGDEEFAVMLPYTGLDVATRLAERLRDTMRAAGDDATPPLPHPLSVTIGVATFPTEASNAGRLVAVADRRLAAGRSAGRNRVVAADA